MHIEGFNLQRRKNTFFSFCTLLFSTITKHKKRTPIRMSFLLFLRSNILRINKLFDVRFLQTEVLFLIDSLQDDTENEGGDA